MSTLKHETRMSSPFEELNIVTEKLKSPVDWEEAEELLFKLVKSEDEQIRLASDILLKDLQRKKFNKFLRRFDSPNTSNEKDPTIQRTVSRTLSMIIPRGLKKDIQASESESDNEAIEKKPSPLPSPKPSRLPPAIPPKPTKMLPKRPSQDLGKSLEDIQKNLNQFNFEPVAQNTYYPTLEELELQSQKQSVKSKESFQKQFPEIQSMQPTPLPVTQPQVQQRVHPPQIPQDLNQEQIPMPQPFQHPEDPKYKLKMLQSYLSMQRRHANDQYVMDSPKDINVITERLTESPSVDIMSSISNRPPADFVQPLLINEPVPELPKVQLDNKPLPHVPPHDGLNTVYLPKLIVQEFLSLSALNTSKNIETCGLLAGKYRKIKKSSIKQSAAYLITHMIIPKQTGTPNSCVMEAEELVANYQIDNDLLTLGWIHTHPTQTCFMSSLDLHTHFPFQLTLPESIAIVVAPTQTPNFGIFRLTDPNGVEYISNCRDTRIFHPHDTNEELYNSQQHCRWVDKPVYIVDLRSK